MNQKPGPYDARNQYADLVLNRDGNYSARYFSLGVVGPGHSLKADRQMRYASAFSGIGTDAIAWDSLGWECTWFAETEKFPSEVLRQRFPNVPNLGDVTKIGEEHGPVDLLVGGPPCQSFSIAGKRKGMDDPRGNLALEFLALARRVRARWFVFENVPGLLSSNKGQDFARLLRAVSDLGYGAFWRVLDAQNFGVPQRRRRVFLVGYLGDWRPATAVLLERQSLRGDSPKGEKSWKAVAALTESSVRTCDADDNQGQAGHLIPAKAATLTQQYAKHSGNETSGVSFVAHSLRGEGFDASEDGTGRGTPIIVEGDSAASIPGLPRLRAGCGRGGGTTIAFTERTRAEGRAVETQEEKAYALLNPGEGGRPNDRQILTPQMDVRRLTPVECERLQGLPLTANYCTIRVWSTGQRKKNALAAEKNPKSPRHVGNVGSDTLPQTAPSAISDFPPNDLSSSRLAAVNVHLDLEAGALALHNLENKIWFANGAERPDSCPLLVPKDVFVRLLALMPRILASETIIGRAAFQQSRKHFSAQKNGRKLVHMCGQEIDGSVEDAENFISILSESLKSTTSGVGPTSQRCGTIWKTWSCYVVSAISSFIPDSIRNANSFDIKVETSIGHTKIAWRGKPPEKCPDGPRYRAIGNAMAVPVLKWIGERIAIVEEIIK